MKCMVYAIYGEENIYDFVYGVYGTIINEIPCFTDVKYLDDEELEFVIECRQEDLAYVEDMIAPFV